MVAFELNTAFVHESMVILQTNASIVFCQVLWATWQVHEPHHDLVRAPLRFTPVLCKVALICVLVSFRTPRYRTLQIAHPHACTKEESVKDLRAAWNRRRDSMSDNSMGPESGGSAVLSLTFCEVLVQPLKRNRWTTVSRYFSPIVAE